ncbi:MAG: hypothetical protein H7240_04040 [Glaciimonas sp.]|nr:hypothetical protein [Glaciimonas sp.]
MASAWINFGGPILLLLSGKDYTAKEFIEYASNSAVWSKAFQHLHLERHDLSNADHTFANQTAQLQVEKITLQWIKTI